MIKLSKSDLSKIKCHNCNDTQFFDRFNIIRKYWRRNYWTCKCQFININYFSQSIYILTKYENYEFYFKYHYNHDLFILPENFKIKNYKFLKFDINKILKLNIENYNKYFCSNINAVKLLD